MNRLEFLLLLMKRKFPSKSYAFYAEHINEVFKITTSADELRRMEEPTLSEDILDKKIHAKIWL